MNTSPAPSAPVASAPSAFVYGTLQVPSVLQRVLGRVPPGAPAVVHDFERRCIEGQCYPAIVTAPGQRATGRVLFALTVAEWALLDVYEGAMYTRQWVSAMLSEGTACPVQSYVLRSEYSHVLGPGDWSLAHFVEHDLEAFLAELE